MSVLTAIQNVSAVIALNKPTVVFSSTEREHFELQVLANSCARYIAQDYEWQALKVPGLIAGDGMTRSFALPADYDRMLKEGELWSDRLQTHLTHIISTDHWLELDIRQFETVTGAWTLLGNEITLKPAPANGEAISYYYMSSRWALDNDGSSKAEFAADDDTFRLPETLLELCMIWKWRAQKGLPYAQDQDNYEDEKEKRIAADKGARILHVGRTRRLRGAQVAYPVSVVS
ncbi:phage adaptor protein [Taklimakanibacter lacteus]|uniref:phage adaptor protein n=1 Tax=Taklimakanibacter lacteus TaxID=2268456 RepID=UPI000E66F3AD